MWDEDEVREFTITYWDGLLDTPENRYILREEAWAADEYDTTKSANNRRHLWMRLYDLSRRRKR